MILSAKNALAQTDEIVGYINNQPVERVELEREIQNNKAGVISQLTQQYKLTDLSNFWSITFDGVKSIDILYKKAWNVLIVAKVQEQLFTAQDLWPYKNTEDLKARMEKINAEREKMKAQGKVIYGPVLFSPKSFYDYEFSNAIIKIKDKLYPRPIAKTTLLAQFDKMKNTVYAKNNYPFEEVKSRVETAFIDEAYTQLVANKVADASLLVK